MSVGDTIIKRRVTAISWTLACVAAVDAIVAAWLLLGGWPLNGWLHGFAAQFPFVVAAVTLSLITIIIYVNRPHPLPWWAMPDEGTLKYGIGLTALITLGVIVCAVIRVLEG